MTSPPTPLRGRGELDTDNSKRFSYSISGLIFFDRFFKISFAFSSSIPQNISALIVHSKGRGELDTNTSTLFSYSISNLIFLVRLFRIRFSFSSSIPQNISAIIVHSKARPAKPRQNVSLGLAFGRGEGL